RFFCLGMELQVVDLSNVLGSNSTEGGDLLEQGFTLHRWLQELDGDLSVEIRILVDPYNALTAFVAFVRLDVPIRQLEWCHSSSALPRVAEGSDGASGASEVTTTCDEPDFSSESDACLWSGVAWDWSDN